MKKHEKKTVNVNPLSNQELIDSYEELYPFLPPVSSADDAPEQAPPSGKNPSDIKG